MTTDKLDSHTLIWAYSHGYFPMPDPETQNILWYRPDPRAIIPLDGFHCSRSLRRRIHRKDYQVTFDQCFTAVMQGCANRSETWINGEFFRAYGELHLLGVAHSVEVWLDQELVGGVYGVALAGAFFAESKFHSRTDASKIALFFLVEHLNQNGFGLLEVQFLTPHLSRLGALEIPSSEYLDRLAEALAMEARF